MEIFFQGVWILKCFKSLVWLLWDMWVEIWTSLENFRVFSKKQKAFYIINYKLINSCELE